MKWVVPAALAAAVVGGLAFLRMENTKIKSGDYVTVNPNSIALPVGNPFAPANAQVLVRVDQVGPDGSITVGQVVGYIDAQTNTPILPGGGAGGFPAPQLRREWLTGHYRGAPPARVV